MINDIHSDLIRGHINTIILKALFEGDRYGYDICREIEERSSGQYKLKQPTLYSCLRRLEAQGYITSYWGGANAMGGRRKYYTLTANGRDLFVKNQTEWEYSRTVIDKLISDRAFDISALPPVEEKFQKRTYGNRDSSIDEANDGFEDGGIFSEDDEEEDALTYDEAEEEVSAQAAASITIREERPAPPQAVEQPEEAAQADMPQDFKYFKLNPDDYNLSDRATSPSLFSGSSYSESIDSNEVKVKEFTPKSFYQSNGYGFSGGQTALPEQEYADDLPYEEAYPAQAKEDGMRFDNKYLEPDVFDYELEKSKYVTSHTEILEDDEQITDRIIQGFKNTAGYSMNSDVKIQTAEDDLAKNYIDKEYQNLIGKIFGESDYYTAADIAPDNRTKIVKSDYKRVNSVADAPFAVSQSNYRRKSERDDEQGRNEKGEVKKHSKKVTDEYNSAYYYYGNRLNFARFGFLCSICIAEILAVWGILLATGFNQNDSALYYGLAVIPAFILLLYAVVPFLISPGYKKRYTFNFGDSMFVRIIVFINALIVVFLINLFGFRVSVNNISEHLVTIILPSVLLTNIPLSAIVFRALYNTKRYAA